MNDALKAIMECNARRICLIREGGYTALVALTGRYNYIFLTGHVDPIKRGENGRRFFVVK